MRVKLEMKFEKETMWDHEPANQRVMQRNATLIGGNITLSVYSSISTNNEVMSLPKCRPAKAKPLRRGVYATATLVNQVRREATYDRIRRLRTA
jgi:hypothetical protein